MNFKEQLIQQRLQTSIQKCNLHLQRLHYASNQLAGFFPLTVDRYNAVSEGTIGNIDQMVFRFTKLQDEIGNNTFRFLLEFLQEDIINKPFRDILNILERLEIIDSADIWLKMREIRNDLTHEYPLMLDETIEKLNHLYNQIPLLAHILVTIEQQTQQS
jgi:hypothetical protein